MRLIRKPLYVSAVDDRGQSNGRKSCRMRALKRHCSSRLNIKINSLPGTLKVKTGAGFVENRSKIYAPLRKSERKGRSCTFSFEGKKQFMCCKTANFSPLKIASAPRSAAPGKVEDVQPKRDIFDGQTRRSAGRACNLWLRCPDERLRDRTSGQAPYVKIAECPNVIAAKL